MPGLPEPDAGRLARHLAVDLRQEIRELMQKGQSDEQVKRYLVARYGDFVLYRPR